MRCLMENKCDVTVKDHVIITLMSHHFFDHDYVKSEF